MPLFPPQDYRKTAFTHRRGTFAARPAATDVLAGTLYFATDTGIIYRSDGSVWETYSGSSTGVQTAFIPELYPEESELPLLVSPSNVRTSIIDIATTGTIQNLDFGNADLVRLTGASTMTVHSIRAGINGQRVTFITTQSTGFFRHNSSTLGGGTLLANFIKTTDADTPITSSAGIVTYQYDGPSTQWRMISHTQGDPIVPTFAAGDFTGSGSMTWTVASGDVGQDAYVVNGKEVTYYFRYFDTTVGGTVSTQLQRAIPSLLTPLNDICYGTCVIIDSGGARTVGAVLVAGATLILAFQKIDLSNWTLSTNTTTIEGQLKWFLT